MPKYEFKVFFSTLTFFLYFASLFLLYIQPLITPTHLAGSIISCSKNPILSLLSVNIQDFNAIWHLYNRLVLLEIIIFKVLHYFSYEE